MVDLFRHQLMGEKVTKKAYDQVTAQLYDPPSHGKILLTIFYLPLPKPA
jgi:hypothetical protein